ncbi:hypothetical protein U0035_10955 [Niabella yanshanensis]|uniref:Collagen-like protein n=1 Tax=Niabella yanshanensis TaxID=577386 RepID=A0ABZ0WD88_9BACT|nr:hypothetical protein [Niabella yanshanensis]WQD40666.1 hypothetical protein U0035_10955 [Niabella yanshanensis]
MMRVRNLLLVMLAFIIAAAACKKGDTGSAGPQGPKGDIGATGADGTQIFSGQGAPAATLGRNGDFYLDLTTSNMYGPRANAGWGAPYALKGANGSNGANGNAGSKIYSGNGAPDNTTGIAGDYFMSTDTYLFYGPKTEAGWGLPVNLKGPKGDKGDAGAGAISILINPSSIRWETVRIYEQPYTIADISIPQIDEDIINNGAILVYRNPRSAGTWTPLPYTLRDEPGRVWLYNYELSVGKLRLTIVKSIGTDFGDESLNTPYRIVIIKGSAIVAAKAKGINFKNYNQVKTIFNLKG